MKTIPALDSQVIRACLLAFVGLVGLIASFFGASEALFEARGAKVVDALLLVWTTGSVVWATYARAALKNPPISQAAADAHASFESGEAASAARDGRLISCVAAIAMVLMFPLLHGCTTAQVQTFDQKLYTVNQTSAAVAAGADQALQAHLITASEAAAVANVLHQVNPLIDAARAAEAKADQADADKTMTLINSLLAGLLKYTATAPK